jgi:ankyrin repeat protein
MALVQRQDGRHSQLPLLLHIASTSRHPHRELAESVMLLVDAGADINTTYTDSKGLGFTALICATESRCCTVVEVLLQADADPCVYSSPERMTALHAAAAKGMPKSCELLLVKAATGTLLEERDTQSLTALMYAAQSGYLDTTQLLLQHGADVNAANRQRKRPIMMAAFHKHANIVCCLLKFGADVNAVAHDGFCALMLAAHNDDYALAQLLLEHGADFTVKDSNGHNALFKAACVGHVSMLEFLVKCGLCVHAVDRAGHTLLMVTAARGHKPAEWLLQQSLDIHAVATIGHTALCCVSGCRRSDDAAMIELLLANGADVHKCASRQRTALELAAYSS